MTCEPGKCRLDEDGACIVNFKKHPFAVRPGSAQRMAGSLFSPGHVLAFNGTGQNEYVTPAMSTVGDDALKRIDRTIAAAVAHSGRPPKWAFRVSRWAHRLTCAKCR